MSTESRRGWILGALCSLPILYILAVGPAVRFGVTRDMVTGMRPANFVGRLWRPLLSLDNTRARRVYRAYMKVWGVQYHEPVLQDTIDGGGF